MEVITRTNLAEVFDELQNHPSANVLAGGTDFLVKWKDKRIDPLRVINIAELNELKYIRVEDGRVLIGALVTHQEVAESIHVRQYATVLADASSQVGSTQIRNRGTIGGNLVTASPAGDTIPALWVLNAALVLKSADSEREVPVREFITGPGKTVLQPGELVTAVSVPLAEVGEIGFYKKLGPRQALAISIVSMAVKMKLGAGSIERISIACGSVGPTVVELKETTQRLIGCQLNPKEIWQRVAEAGNEASPITDVRASREYRQKMVGALLYEGLCDFCTPQDR